MKVNWYFGLILLLAIISWSLIGCSDDGGGHGPDPEVIWPFDLEFGLTVDVSPAEFGEMNNFTAAVLPGYDGGGRLGMRGVSGGRIIGYFLDCPDSGFGAYSENLVFEAGKVVRVSVDVLLRSDLEAGVVHAEAIYDSMYIPELDRFLYPGQIEEYFGFQAGSAITNRVYVE